MDCDGWFARLFHLCGDTGGSVIFHGEVITIPDVFKNPTFNSWLTSVQQDGFDNLQQADSTFMASKEETIEVGQHRIDVTKIRTIDPSLSRTDMFVYVIHDTLTWPLGGDDAFEIAPGYSADLRKLLAESDVRAGLETANYVAGVGLSSSYANSSKENAQLSVRRASKLCLLLKQWGLVDINRQALWSVPLGYSQVAAQKDTKREREQRRVVIIGVESLDKIDFPTYMYRIAKSQAVRGLDFREYSYVKEGLVSVIERVN
jgi:hypothetical protein